MFYKRKEKPKPSKLYTRVRHLIINRPRTITLVDLSHECEVTRSWLNGIIADHNASENASHLERVYEFLTKKELEY
jgi:hypothetical protein